MDKSMLRRTIGEKKRAMTAREIDTRSAALAEALFSAEQWRKADALYAYLSFNQEVRTRPVIERAWADGKRVAVPKIVGGEMRFIWISDFGHLRRSAFGVEEPEADGPIAQDGRAHVLVPGLAFDARGNRLGYGGGHYDRWLAAHPGHPTMALCFDFQMVDVFETQPHDVPVDRVIVG